MLNFLEKRKKENVVTDNPSTALPANITNITTVTNASTHTTKFILELINQIKAQTDLLIKEDGISTNNFNSLLSNENYTKEQIQEIQLHLERVATGSTQTKDLLDGINGELNHSFEELAQARQRNEVMVAEMNRVIEVFAQFNLLFTEMYQEYRQIEKFASVISGIASKTKLLSLNASIEAARAGEHGRGFGVVADEIKKLSENTQSNAKSIISSLESMTSIIGRLSDKTDEGTQMMPTTQQMVKASSTILDKIESIETNLVNSLDSVTQSQDNNITAIDQINTELINLIEKSDADNTQYKKLILGVQRKADYYLELLHYLKQIDALREDLN
ncbi:MAG: methyl-accepting chemotaxis protein [Mobilitalea sp.]